MSNRWVAFALLLAVGGNPPCAAANPDLFAIGAVVFDEPLTHLEMVELRVQPSRRVTLGGMLVRSSTHGVLEEIQLRAHATISANPGTWVLESRHLLTHGSQTELRYRHRLRIIGKDLFGVPSMSLRGYDEYFADLNGRGSLRNVLTLGMGLELGKRGVAEIYHAWSDERVTRDTRYWLLILSWRGT